MWKKMSARWIAVRELVENAISNLKMVFVALSNCSCLTNKIFKSESNVFNEIYRWLLNQIHYLFTQYVVMPTRRSTAEAFQILISHAFGDAGSPYLIGLVSTYLIILNCHEISYIWLL